MEVPHRQRPIGLCLLCGLPGAGKSTLAAALRERQSRYAIAVISYDAILAEDAYEREAESREIACQEEGGTEQSVWKKYRQHLLQCLERLILSLISGGTLQAPSGNIAGSWERFCRCLEDQGLISAASSDSALVMNPAHRPLYLVLDDNFYYQSMRYEVYQLARKYSVGFCQLYLQCPAELCLQRNRSRRGAVTEETILLMERRIEPPNAERNSWEENSLVLDGSTGVATDEAKITGLLQRVLDNPVRPLEDDSEEKERDREICAASLIHQADQSLRRLISDTMQSVRGSVSAQDIRIIAQQLQRVKSKALEELRQQITAQTLQADNAGRAFNVQHFFTAERDRMLRPYLWEAGSLTHVDRQTPPPTS